jgi:hypothetical protein
MLSASTLALVLFAVILAACRIWLRLAWRRTQRATAEPAWHEKVLGHRRKTASDLEDMNPAKILSPLILRGMPNNPRSFPPWHEQWLAGGRESDDDNEWTTIEPLGADELRARMDSAAFSASSHSMHLRETHACG